MDSIFAGAQDFHHRLAKLVQSHDEHSKLGCGGENKLPLPPLPRVPLSDKSEHTGTCEEDEQSLHDYAEVSVATHQSVSADDIDKLLHTTKVLKSSGHERKAKISFYDFAGQDIFHASHPTFLSSKAIYIVVFNLKSMLERENEGSEETSSHLTRDMDSDEGRMLKYT